MEVWKMTEPYPGAHIRVQASGVFHHGIYIGNDEVVQFGNVFNLTTNPSDITVHKAHINDFLNGGFLEVRQYTKKEKKIKRSDEEIVKIAVSKIGEAGYDLLKNNCEHFANYCIFGEKTSKQVDDIHLEIRKKLGIKK